MSIYMHEQSKESINRSIFIAGNARSGTTILGKLLYSMQRVEYAFEPPALFSLLPLIDGLPKEHFMAIYEAYCYEDLLLGAIAGRNINQNRNDDSSIYLAKSFQNVSTRLGKSWSKDDQVTAAKDAILCIKMPDTALPLVTLKKYYPAMRVIATHRKANPVIDSILKKGWFKNSNLQNQNLIWPSQHRGELLVPVWVEKDKIHQWNSWNELERAAYYYCVTTIGLTKIPQAISFSYERMLESPEQEINKLAKTLGLEFGENTAALLSTVEKKSKSTEDWVAKLPPTWQTSVREAEASRENV
jgi:hypothetical protein